MRFHGIQRKKKAKIQAQREHAKKRFFQRYGVEYTKNVKQYMIKQIQKGGNADLILRQSHRVSLYYVRWKGQRFPVAYDKQRKEIITVLTDDMINDIFMKQAEMLWKED